MTDTGNTLFDRLLDWIVRVVKDRRNPQGILQTALRWTRRTLLAATLAYVIFLLTLLAALEWHGERNWLLSFLLYLPAQGWLLPLLPLTPLCLIFRPRLCLWHLFCLVAVLFFYMDYHWSRWPEPKGPTIKLITNNRGEANRQSLTPFIEAENPDLIALQEAGRLSAFAQAYPNHHVAAHDEFTLISKFPIKASGVLPAPTFKGKTVAAWFELDCRGQTLIVYNIHMPSPRRDLDQLRGLGFPALVFSSAESRYGRMRREYQESWALRRQVALELRDVVAREQRPCLIAGDLNVPAHGYTYHLFAARFADAFDKRGRGYGFTLPGTTRNPLSLFGPWLRIDYIFSNTVLKPVYCRTEPHRKSQHRAVVATFEWSVPKENLGQARQNPDNAAQ